MDARDATLLELLRALAAAADTELVVAAMGTGPRARGATALVFPGVLFAVAAWLGRLEPGVSAFDAALYELLAAGHAARVREPVAAERTLLGALRAGPLVDLQAVA